jgi:dihydroceramidase
VDWCEPNYAVSPYIAEFWNTVSSVFIVAAGAFAWASAVRYGMKRRFLLAGVLMTFVGIGSILFHGTLKYSGQVVDELSMVYAVSTFLFIALEMGPTVQRKWLAAAIVAYDAAFTIVYALAPRYFDLFVVLFFLGCVLTVLQSVYIYRLTYDQRLRRLFWVGFALFGLGFFAAWIPDMLFCESVGWLNLHAWFHITSAIAPYWWTVWASHNYYTRRYAERTGLLRLADGRIVSAPTDLRRSSEGGDVAIAVGQRRGGKGKGAQAGTSGGEDDAATDRDASRPSSRPSSPERSRVSSDASDPSSGGEGGAGRAASPAPPRARGGTEVTEVELRWYGPQVPPLIVVPFLHLTTRPARGAELAWAGHKKE